MSLLVTVSPYYRFLTTFQHCLHITWRMFWSASQSVHTWRPLDTWTALCLSSYKLLLPLKVESGLKTMLYRHCGLFNKGWILFAHTTDVLHFWYSRYFPKKKRLASVTYGCCKNSSIWNHEHEKITVCNSMSIHYFRIWQKLILLNHQIISPWPKLLSPYIPKHILIFN